MAGFKSAFAAARKAGKKTFDWNGKSYNTKTAPDLPKTGPTPSARPGSDKTKAPKGPSGADRKTQSKDTLNRSAIKKTNETTRETVRKKNERNK